MSRASGEFVSRDIERRQWSEFNDFRHEILLRGRGEGLVEVYFGKGFSSPPTFTFSAVFDQEEEDVWSWHLVPPEGNLAVDTNGFGSDSQGQDVMIQDPSFEAQGQFLNHDPAAAEILFEEEVVAGALLPIAQLAMSLHRVPQWAERGVWPYGWVQTHDVRELWSIAMGESNVLGVGESGRCSAVARIGSSGFTNWLIPFHSSQSLVFTVLESANSSWNSVVQEFPPPFLGGFRGFLYVKSDSEVEVQVSARFAIVQGPEIATVDFSAPSSGPDWRRVEVELPYDGWRIWPKCEIEFGPNQSFWRLQIRVKGEPGTLVHLDDIYLDREIRNAEIPILTVGVDEWIRDKSGVYVGAKLWVTTGATRTNLCVPLPLPPPFSGGS